MVQFDCCRLDPDYAGNDEDKPQEPSPGQYRCGDENCECSNEDIAQYINSLNSGEEYCETVDQTSCIINPGFVIFAVPTENICETDLDPDPNDGNNVFDSDDTENQVQVDEAQADFNGAFKCLYYSALVKSFTLPEYDCVDSEGRATTCTTLNCENGRPITRGGRRERKKWTVENESTIC